MYVCTFIYRYKPFKAISYIEELGMLKADGDGQENIAPVAAALRLAGAEANAAVNKGPYHGDDKCNNNYNYSSGGGGVVVGGPFERNSGSSGDERKSRRGAENRPLSLQGTPNDGAVQLTKKRRSSSLETPGACDMHG